MNWIKVPQFVYNILLIGSWLLVILAVAMLIYGFFHRKHTQFYKNWIITLIVAVIVVILTMTGKIAGHMMFGG